MLTKLPWKKDDNPNAWVEPTTYCQLKCPGCYRGLAEPNPKREHENLQKMKDEIDWHVQNRNVQTISIAGGEPLMYPQIEELVSYAYNKGLKTKIYTNGIMLSEEKLVKLKDAGCTECVIHIDKTQGFEDNEEALIPKRQEFVDMFRNIKGINLGFIMPLSNQSLSDLPLLSKFFQKNSDIINLIVFTLMTEMLPNKLINSMLKTDMDTVSEAVKQAFNLDYCSFLGKKGNDKISWLFSLSAYEEGKIVGSYDGEHYLALQQRYYAKYGKYFLTINNYPTPKEKIIPYSINKSVQKILANSKKTLNHQVVLLIDAPEEKNGWDLCDGCPDAMLYEGKLVPSCLLERIHSGEEIIVE